ncbi:PARP8-like protein [Mya arenaria]|uniref:Poly [ADP-ribose] polymerase n=1 Tax=Mya arenaria TaxID=6604 RepID=A0ABY7EM11_MYAAR|nr:protein mono-ADP-ribosyltransferase PARP6-like [Mya arenaria]WAR09668.1 PARP8-like protein [Mya arenaria]
MDELRPPPVERSDSCASGASLYTDALEEMPAENYLVPTHRDHDDDDDGGSEVAYSDDDHDDQYASQEAVMHPYLYRDMDNLIFLYGENVLQYRLFESIDEIDIELHVPLSFLEEVIADAWKVNKYEPLIIRLHLSLSQYIESVTVPNIEVFQPSKKEGFGFGSQVRKFLETFLVHEWKNIQQEYLKSLKREETLKKSTTFPVTEKAKMEHEVNDEDVARLAEMGFPIVLARNALLITHGSVKEASNLLVYNPETCTDINVRIEQLYKKPGESKELEDDSSEGKATSGHSTPEVDQHGDKKPKLGRQHSHPAILLKLKKMLPTLKRATSIMPELEIGRQIEDLNLMPLTLDGKNAKNIPSISDGLLVQVFRYVRQRIPTMNEYCVVCDELHIFQSSAMLKPAVCNRELCVFAFQTLGVMADAAEDIATGAEVVDLLINMTKFAAKSNRREIIFDPYPTVVHPKVNINLLFNPKNKDFNAVEKVVNDMPPMQEMVAITALLRQKLNNRNPAVYPLIQWIINSNRSHIVKLPVERQLKFMVTPHQFLLISSPPAKEVIFQQAKQNHGSTFAFHGSSIENWHSIIRQGLVNASGTKMQVNGAAYGKGIYLSPHISTSMGYSRMGYGSINVKKGHQQPMVSERRFLCGDNIRCIAICEVVTSKDLKKNNAIWVCPDQNHVCTRFFFVYEDGQVSDSSIDTQDQKILNQIKEACDLKY